MSKHGSVLMKCGHVANASKGGQPVCVICLGIVAGADEVAPESDLTGRKSMCDFCDGVQMSEGTTIEGKRLWRGPLPFLRLNPDYNEAEGRLDSHYCGCRGWD